MPGTTKAVVGLLAALTLLLAACGGNGADVGDVSADGAGDVNADASGDVNADEIRVAIVPGGPHPYFEPMEPAVEEAMAEFGLTEAVYRVPETLDLTAQNRVIEALVAQGYNAFGIFPMDADGMNGTIDELFQEGIPSATLGGCVNEPSKALFCLATDVAESAYTGTTHLIDAMGGEGRIVHVTGFLDDPNTVLRMDAVERAIEEAGGSVELIQHITDIDDEEAADRAINSFMAAHRDDVDGFIATAFIPAAVSAQVLATLGDESIRMVGIDDDPVVLDAIRDGVVVGTMIQNPWGQAYIGAYALDLVVTQGCEMREDAPFHIDSGTLFVDADNVDTYDENRKQLTKEIQSTFKDDYMEC